MHWDEWVVQPVFSYRDNQTDSSKNLAIVSLMDELEQTLKWRTCHIILSDSLYSVAIRMCSDNHNSYDSTLAFSIFKYICYTKHPSQIQVRVQRNWNQVRREFKTRMKTTPTCIILISVCHGANSFCLNLCKRRKEYVILNAEAFAEALKTACTLSMVGA